MKKWIFSLCLVSNALLATIARKDVPVEHTWDLTKLYASDAAWQNELDALITSTSAPFFPQIAKFKGRLSKSPALLVEHINNYYDIERKLTKLGVYANLHHSEDIANPIAKEQIDKITTIFQQFQQECSWIQPEILSFPQSTMDKFIQAPELAAYRIALERLMRQKPHVLNASEEEIIALATQSLGASERTYSAMHNADMKYEAVLDSQGIPHELTHGTYQLYMQSADRTLRKNSYHTTFKKYLEFENSLSEIMAGTAHAHNFNAKARHYDSCLHAALAPNAIDVKVYHTFIEAVRNRVDLLHRYVALRKKVLQLDELHPYDLSVPLVPNVQKSYTFEEAQALTLEAVKPLGKEYVAELKRGLTQERWVDRFENQNKMSGGFSSGCYDSMPYILMNYHGSLRDVFTLAHEAGHSMHSLYTRRAQPYQYSNYSIFVAEVASTFNEELLRNMLLQRAQTAEEKAFLISQKLDDVRNYLFRVSLSAEFELFIHQAAEKGTPITPKLLKDKYAQLLAFYYGPDFTIDDISGLEWVRVPHYHLNFYMFQYGTGIAASLSLANQVLTGGEVARERYLAFLSAGSSDDPINLLAQAGCDMRSTAAVSAALDQFGTLLDDFERYLVD